MPRQPSRGRNAPTAPRPNAAIYYVPGAYSTSGPQLMGINAACEGMLRAMAVHAGVDRLYAFAEHKQSGDMFDTVVRGFNPAMTTEWIPTNAAERLVPVQTLFLPGPGLSAYAWMRRRLGSSAFSLCGVTHSTATPLVLDAIADLWTAPIEPWDALICTSLAVRSMVTRVLEEQEQYLEERFGAIAVARPQLPVIPLGVNAESFRPDAALRAEWRGKLGMSEHEVALLYLGRLDPIAKAHPIPLFLATAAASRRTAAPLHLILAGWFSTPGLEAAFREAASQICPQATITVVDAREPMARNGVWRAADIFVSPVDNIQESFGLTPVEAMAAGLPVIASDWDGYRDTVRHGIDGLLIPTATPPPGSSLDMARDLSARTLDADAYRGFSSQAVAVDISVFADSIASLAESPALRAAMGADGQRRAQSDFDWAHIIERYQELWRDLAERRSGQARPPPKGSFHPARPDPFRAFASYPTALLSPVTRLKVGVTAPQMIEVLLESPLVSFAKPSLPNAEALAAMLARIEELGDAAAEQIVIAGSPEEAAPLWRGLAWLMKYGLVRLA